MPRILLLTDDSANPNWGAQAMFAAIHRMLEDSIPGVAIKWFKRPWLQMQFRQLRPPFPQQVFYQPSQVPRILRPIERRLSREAEFFPDVVDDFEYIGDQWMSGRGGLFASEFMAAAEESDVIVFNGEGHIQSNRTAGVRSLFLLWFAKTRLGKPCCAIDHTTMVSSETRPIMRGMVKLVYPILDVVTVREPYSLRDLHDLGLKKVQLVPDVVFLLDPNEGATDSFRKWKAGCGLDVQPYFCVSAGDLPMSWPYPGRATEGSVIQLVRQLKKVVPQAVIIAKDKHYRFMVEVAKETDSICFGPEHRYVDLWPLLMDAVFLVTGHYHHVIASAKVGCPFIPFTTDTYKIESLCELLNWEVTKPYDPTAISFQIDEIYADANRIVKDRNELSQHLLNRSCQLSADAVKNALLIKECLEL